MSDDGKGFDLKAAESHEGGRGRGGNGLLNMRQRVANAGGHCFITSSPGAGSCVTVRIPLNKTKANGT